MRSIFILLPALLFIQTTPTQQAIPWQNLDQGLDYASWQSPVKSIVGDSKIDILRIDPRYYQLQLKCSGETKGRYKTAKTWADENKWVAGFNAGMFEWEGKANGYMKNYTYINNPVLRSDYNAILAFNAKDTTVPAAQIIDKPTQDWKVLNGKYQSFSQSIRMLTPLGKNTWQKDEKKWSMVVTATDAAGRVYFIFSRSPYRVHDFINILLSANLQLNRMMYLEGGPEASFYLNHPKCHVEKFGSYETGFWENDKNDRFWEIPNVLGVVKK